MLKAVSPDRTRSLAVSRWSTPSPLVGHWAAITSRSISTAPCLGSLLLECVGTRQYEDLVPGDDLTLGTEFPIHGDRVSVNIVSCDLDSPPYDLAKGSRPVSRSQAARLPLH